jgi:glycosyltransferase involved in cell wall biosynthesis
VKVSICIPTYESKKLVKRAIDSAVSQVGIDFEIIVSDDSRSTDIEELIKTYEFPISYFKNTTPAGSPENWNCAIAKAKGKYIHLLHHDDCYHNQKSLLTMIDAIEENNSQILFSRCLWNPEFSYQYIERGMTPEQNADLQSGKLEKLFGINFISVPSVMIFEKALNLKYDKSLIYMVDVDFYLSALKLVGNNFAYSQEPSIIINIESSTQVTNKIVNPQIKKDEWSRLHTKWKDYFSNKSSNFEAEYKNALIREGLL